MTDKAKLVVLSMILAALLTASSHSGESPFRIGLRTGVFIPQDWRVQGQAQINHLPDGSTEDWGIFGFGNGFDLSLYAEYNLGTFGLRLDSGFRLHNGRRFSTEDISGRVDYESRLEVIPVELSMIYRMEVSDERISPYFGFGPGLYISRSEDKTLYNYSTFGRVWEKGSKTVFGACVIAGLDYILPGGLFFGIECRYSYAPSDWKFENQDSDSFIESKDLNIGGTSLKAGLGYRF